MCLIALALGMRPDLPFVLAANRDEFHVRPTAPARRWDDLPDLFGGRDLQQGGTWLAVAERGAIAAVTNYRDPSRRVTGARSRGHLVRDFLADAATTAGDYVRARVDEGDRHDGFNLLAFDGHGAWYGSNRGRAVALGPGLHALSNHLLDTPWPKARRVRDGLSAALARDDGTLADRLFALLRDRTPVPDHELPATGVPLEWERRLGPPFIVSPDYGTRCSTVILVDARGMLRFEERTYGPDGEETGRVGESLRIAAPLRFTAATEGS